MSSIDSQALQGLLDREAIRECMYSYCRGIDRVDEEALRASYWPDATDRHGPYQGSSSGFIDWALAQRKVGGRMAHIVGNMSITVNGNQAAVETYFQMFAQERLANGDNRQLFLVGRYADRFEKRGQEWRVAARIVIYDWIDQKDKPYQTDLEWFSDFRKPLGAPKPDDAFYEVLKQVQQAS